MATGPGLESLVDQTISVITNDGRNIVKVESRIQILGDLRELASAESLDSFTLIYTNILEHQPDCPPEVVEKLVGLREGIPQVIDVQDDNIEGEGETSDKSKSEVEDEENDSGSEEGALESLADKYEYVTHGKLSKIS